MFLAANRLAWESDELVCKLTRTTTIKAEQNQTITTPKKTVPIERNLQIKECFAGKRTLNILTVFVGAVTAHFNSKLIPDSLLFFKEQFDKQIV